MFLCHYVLNSRLLFLWLLCLNYFITLLQHVRGQSALCCQINVNKCKCKCKHTLYVSAAVMGYHKELPWEMSVTVTCVLQQLQLGLLYSRSRSLWGTAWIQYIRTVLFRSVRNTLEWVLKLWSRRSWILTSEKHAGRSPHYKLDYGSTNAM